MKTESINGSIAAESLHIVEERERFIRECVELYSREEQKDSELGSTERKRPPVGMAKEPAVAKPRERVSEVRPKDRFRSDASEQAVQGCYDLLSSGHSLSKMLVALKQIGPLNKAKSELVDAPGDPQISHLADEVAAPPQSEILQVLESVEVSRSLVALNIEPSQQRARDEEKWSRPIGALLFWLIPAMSVMLLGVASKPLIEAGLLRNSGSATTGAETAAAMPAITEVGRTAPERPQAARDPATQAVIAAPANNQDRGPRIQERPAMKPSSLPTSRPAQQPHTEFYRSSPNEWRIPTRLTDGF